MRYSLVFLASAVLSGAVIANAVIQKKQFYPSVVYISKSNPSMAVSITVLYIFIISSDVYVLNR
jgi:E3 ubiquitin-protein ligase synoviolin